MKSEFQIGKILKPRGLKGEIKVRFYSPDSGYVTLKHVIIDGISHDVQKVILSGEFGFMQISDINTIEQAEELRDKEITVKREELPPLEEGSFYVDDILGAEVFVAGKSIGNLYDVVLLPGTDLFCVRTQEENLCFPAVKKLITEMNFEEKKIVLDEKLFDEFVYHGWIDDDEI